MEAMTFKADIPCERKEALAEAVEKLNKRANKLGLPPVVLTFGAPFWRTHTRESDVLEQPVRMLYVPAEVVGTAIHFDGWQVVAAVDVLDAKAGLVIVRSHREERPEWRQNVGQCDHCGISRRRNKTVVIEHTSGEQKMLGVDCLRDFVPSHGRDLEAVLRLHEMLIDLLATTEEEDESCGSRESSWIEPSDFLPYVAELVLNHGGYVSATTAERLMCMSTVGAAMMHRWGRDIPNRIKPSEQARELARSSLEWAAALAPTSSYEQNIHAIAVAGFASHKHIGFLGSIVPAYQRTLERARERKYSQETSKHVGTVGEKLACKVALIKVIGVDSMYGVTHLHIFADDAGNRLKWFCSGMRPDFPKDGALVDITATVKEHGVRDGVQETALSRVKIGKPAKARKVKVKA